MEGTLSLYGYFLESNFAGQAIVVVLAMLSVVSWALLIAKYLQLNKVDGENAEFERLFQSGQIVSDENIPFYAIWHSFKSNVSGLDGAIEKQMFRYEGIMTLIGSISSVGPLLGLLGTVWGLMDAFGAVAASQNSSIQTLAPGVAGALLTTVAGLLVAIPTTIGYNLLSVKIRHMECLLQDFADKIKK